MNKSYYILFAIVLIGLFIRIFRFDSVPPGLYQDETAIGYNAYSILETGKDEHGAVWPVYFKSFNDNKLPLYIYSTSAAMRLLGVNDFSIRFTSLLSGVIAIALIYGIVKILFDNNTALVSSLLLALNPWHIAFSRAAFEVNFAVTLLLAGILTFLLGITKKNVLWFGFSLVFFVLSIYTYNVTRIFAPLMLLIMLGVYRKEVKSMLTRKSLTMLMIIGVLIMAPITIATLQGQTGLDKQATVFIFGKPAIARYLELRSYMQEIPAWMTTMAFNNMVMTIRQYVYNLGTYFSTEFFFVNADPLGLYGVGSHGMFYLFEMATMVYGFIYLLKNRTKNSNVVFYWLLAGVLLTSISVIVPHGTRSYILVVPLTIVSAVGLTKVWEKTYRMSRVFGYSIRFAVVCILAASFSYFYLSYLYKMPVYYASKWRSQDRLLAEYLLESEPNYQDIIIDKQVNFAYTSLLLYQRFDPLRYHAESSYAPDGNLIYLERAKPYTIKNIDWNKDYQEGALLISKTEFAPETLKPIKIFSYPIRPVVLEYDGIIAQYPTQDEAYAVFTKNTSE